MQGRLDMRSHFHNVSASDYDPPPEQPASLPSLHSSSAQVTQVLRAIQAADFGSLGDFLSALFYSPHHSEQGRTREHATAVSKFLGGRSHIHADQIVELMYSSPLARPGSQTRTAAENMAQHKLFQWAMDAVTERIDNEADQLASKRGGLRLPMSLSWMIVRNFSLSSVLDTAQTHAPTTIQLLSTVALSRSFRKKMKSSTPSTPSAPTPLQQLDDPFRSIHSKRGPS